MTDTPLPPRHAVTGWAELSDEALLKTRICDLDLRIEGTELEDRVRVLFRELEEKGLRKFRPDVYLGDEWFTPENVPAISIPFFLAHPRLRAIEEQFMLDVEGGDEEECLKLLRHECGHCLDNAYRISRKKRWQEIFGSASDEYEPDTYRPRPYSRSFVVHLENWYSQAHPSEDFAETFAVWLTPGSGWESRYARWPAALAKLRYVDDLARGFAGREPPVRGGRRTYEASRMQSTLERYYRRKVRQYREEYPDFFDSDLRMIFSGGPDLPKRHDSAGRFLQRNRRTIVATVSRWTGERKYVVNNLIKKLAARCQEIDLRTGRHQAHTHLEVAAYLAALVTRHQFTGRFKRTV